MIRFLKSLFMKRPTDCVDGGVVTRIDRNAPKTVVSENIVSFSCVFSTVAICDDIPIEHGVYTLCAKLTGGTVNCKFELRTRYGDGKKLEFVTEDSFLKELQKIVRKYDFAKYNGMEHRVSGLPDMYGARIHVEYDSGESIYSSDNQSNFLPIESMSELVKLFLMEEKE